MNKTLVLTVVASSLFVGCASVPMTNKSLSDSVKQFNKPAQEKSGIYVYRGS
jgi:hypothetical protein